MGKKKYKKQLLKSLKSLGKSEHLLLESMTNLMLLGELKKIILNLKMETPSALRIIFLITAKTKTSEKWQNFVTK
jgi:hypothetical protein